MDKSKMIYSHNWRTVSVGMYDTLYECEHCKKAHIVQADNPDETALPIDACLASRCSVCGVPFKEGGTFQAFLRSPEDEEGSWTKPVYVDAEFQNRHRRNGYSEITRVHTECRNLGIRNT